MKASFAIFALLGSLVAQAVEVTEVKVVALDGFGGDVGSAVSRCQTRKGSEYDPAVVTRDVGSLRNSGEFEEISADADRTDDGVRVSFYVKRKVRFQGPLAVEGADRLGTGKVISAAALKDGYLYGEGDLAEAASKVRDAYLKKHYPDAKVTPVAESLGGNNVRVTMAVVEGEQCKIRDYAFNGIDGAAGLDGDELRAAVGVYPWWDPRGWIADEPVTEEQNAQARAKAETYCRDRGYLDARVTGPERVRVADGEADAVFTVSPGRRYVVGESRIVGLTRYPEDVVRAKGELPAAGAVAGRKDLDEAAHRIEVAVGSGDLGLADTTVEVQTIPAADGSDRLDVVYRVREGVPVVINDIKVLGNEYTKDKVIRREISLGPGDRMLADHAERSKRRLENLDYFSRVNYRLLPTDKGKDANGAEYRDLVYEVEEKNTGSFMVGLGASSVDSVFVSAEVSQSNFDLFAPSKLFRGGGQKARLYVAAGPRIQTYEASITEPHLFDRLLELTVEGYRRQRWYDDYDIIRTGGAATLAYPVKFTPDGDPFGRLGFRLSGEFIEFDDVEDDWYSWKGRYGRLLKEEEHKYGDAFEPVLRVFWSRNATDNFRTPSRGMRTQLFADIAPVGDNQYWRLGFNHRNYFTVWERYRHVLMVAFRGETIDGISDDVPIYNRMFLGGPKSIRGIEYRNVSAFARRTNSDGDGRNDYIPWGGQTLFCANVEYTVPIVKLLRLAVFSDLGSVGEDAFDLDMGDTFAWTAGVGLRIDVPMFPIRLDFAAPIEKPDHAERELFSFSVGYDF